MNTVAVPTYLRNIVIGPMCVQMAAKRDGFALNCIGLYILLSILFVPLQTDAQTILTEGTNLNADASRVDGRIVFNLLGTIWLLPANGGLATKMPNTVLPARAPRWSPLGQHILYQSSSSMGNQLWLHDIQSQQSRRLSLSEHSDQQASWHPSGDRVVFSSSAAGSGLDLWEIDVSTGLRWRLTSNQGDESEASWSANGQHLVYVLHDECGWSLMLRRRGEPDKRLLNSPLSIRAPSWRPDGSLITFLREATDGFSLDMIILSDPPMVRSLSKKEDDFFMSPVSWLDRHRMIYSADGQILARNFDQRRARPIRFRAHIGNTGSQRKQISIRRELPIITPPSHQLVIRAARLYDGIGRAYRHDVDVAIDGAVIREVENRRDWPDATVLDLGDVTIMPGFVDLYSALPTGKTGVVGASFLAYGITTIISDDAPGELRPELWHSGETPGPRLLSAASIKSTGVVNDFFLATVPENTSLESGPVETLQPWQDGGNPDSALEMVRYWQSKGIPILANNWTVGLGLGVDLLLGADSLPTSPHGRQYQDRRMTAGRGPVILVSGMADSGTPGMRSLLNSRQAHRLGQDLAIVRHLAGQPQLATDRSSIVLGSKPNGLPQGLALHAELRALAAAGLSGAEVLGATGSRIGKLLGLEQQIGRVSPGAFADLVLVRGDPLANVSDTLNIVAVIRNGRFYSLVSLLERAGSAASVE